MKTVCVFCGSRSGNDPALAEAARDVGRRLGERGLTLVYGGGNSGLMGETARAALAAGGQVIGIQPRFLDSVEPPTAGLTEFVVVDSMHVRKALMYERSNAFLVLPGALGTLDELFEIYTWGQLGLHQKPVAILNVAGYYDLLLAFLDSCVAKGVLRAEVRALLMDGSNVDDLLDRMTHYTPTAVGAVALTTTEQT